MQILLDNGAYELGNVGDIAMLHVAVRRLRALWPGAVIHVLNDHPDELRRLVPESQPLLTDGRNMWFLERNILGPVYRLAPHAATPALDALERSVRLHMHRVAEPWIVRRLRHRRDIGPMEAYLRAFRAADLVAASGGGYLNDSFPRHAMLVLQTLQEAQNRGKITALFGQGIGPMTNPALRRLARRVLPRVACIALREGRAGVALLRELGVPDEVLVVTGDDAIEASYAQRKEELGIGLGVNVRIAAYSGLDQSALAGLAGALEEVLRTTGAAPVPVPVSFHAGDSDSRSLRELFQMVGRDVAVPERLDPEEVMVRVSNCRVVLTGSYHAGVFALSQGIPVVALAQTRYYEEKFDGLSEQFPGGVRVVRPQEGDRVAQSLLESWGTARESRDALLGAADAQIRAGREAYARLAALVPKSVGAA